MSFTTILINSLSGKDYRPTDELLFVISSWRFYKVTSGIPKTCSHNYLYHYYHIERAKDERIHIKLRISSDGNEVMEGKFYFLKKNTDAELAYFVTMILLNEISSQIPFPDKKRLKSFAF